MVTAELRPGMWIATPAGLCQVLTNQQVFSRGGKDYWRTVFVMLSDDLESIEIHIVSNSDYEWLMI